MRRKIRFALRCAADEILRFLRIRDTGIPPLRLVRVSSYKTFREAGAEWKEKLISEGELRPGNRILDIGCGSGRVAIALIDYISREGSYDGIDIRADEIDWLNRNIAVKKPNFRFHHSDLLNKFYNPSGTIDPCEYTFPFEDNSFDYIMLTSIFTHMLPRELEHYLLEIKRLLINRGTLFASFFLLNDITLRNIRRGTSSREFANRVSPYCYSDNVDIPEDAVAYEENHIKNLYKDIGLKITNQVQGRWSFAKELNATHDYQDIIVAKTP